MSTKVLLEGDKARLLVYVTEQGEIPVQSFVDDLTPQEQKGIVQIFNRFTEIGVIYDEQRFRNEGNGIYVFKYKRVRICCFFQPDTRPKTLVLTHGFKKKSQKMDPAEKKCAIRIMNTLLQER